MSSSRWASSLVARARPALPTLFAEVSVLGVLVGFSGEPSLIVVYAAAAIVWQVVGLYSRRFTLSVLDDIPMIGLGVIWGAVLSSVALQPVGLGQLFLPAAVVFAADVVARFAAYSWTKARRRRGTTVYPALIVGCGEVGVRLAERIASHPDTGLRALGFLDDAHEGCSPELPAPYLGRAEDLEQVVGRVGATDVIVCDGSMSSDDVVDCLRTCTPLEVSVYAVPRLIEFHRSFVRSEQVWGLPLERIQRYTVHGFTWRLKRTMDIVLSGLALLLLAPVMLGVAVAVRWELGQGVIFRQERVGLDGRTFTVRKFRSMASRPPGEQPWSVAGGDELGRVGAFIRRYSLDEIPQLLNVLLGDMSLVGPRPERPHYVRRFTEEVRGYGHRHRVPVGLTGLAAVEGLRGDTSISERAYFDNLYIENWSLWLDIKILARTVVAVLHGTGR